ncbi:MAG: hypothetical protein M4D80_10535 [Myxococcota bacterium]|nr:hypothetical protein [Deltaproteobacteria bacterium]MDQ3335592.1 hypothetical protein [Myxococcota bacterium]
MRIGLLSCLFLIACGGGGGTSDMNMGDDTPDGGDIPQPKRGFQIVTPDITIKSGEEVTYCYYFRTPNTEAMAIKKWESVMTPGSHHLIMFTTGTQDKMPPGTVSASGCGAFGGGLNVPNWTYSAQTPTASMSLPVDDGAGKPLAIDIPPNTAGYVQMHYYNPTDNPIQAHVTINAEALDAGVAFTKTAAYVTYNGQISIPAGATNDVEMQSCNTPAGAKFWLMSTHAHKQAIKTEILDGTDQVFMSTDWEHPGAATWMSNPFRTFASGKVTFRCTYNNPTNRVITDGDSAATDEMCMASGYYFPATKALICYDGQGPF